MISNFFSYISQKFRMEKRSKNLNVIDAGRLVILLTSVLAVLETHLYHR